MSEESAALSEAIQLDREELLNEILGRLGYNEIDQGLFNELMSFVEIHDAKRFKYSKALEGQEVVDHYLKNRLI